MQLEFVYVQFGVLERGNLIGELVERHRCYKDIKKIRRRSYHLPRDVW